MLRSVQEWGTPHTVARFGLIWPDLLVAAWLKWGRGGLVLYLWWLGQECVGVAKLLNPYHFRSFPIISTVRPRRGGNPHPHLLPEGEGICPPSRGCEVPACAGTTHVTNVRAGEAVAQWAVVVGWEARAQTRMRGSRLRGNDGFVECLFSSGYTLLTPVGVSATILSAWWLERSGTTRSHPEHGSETLQRRRYW